MLLPVANTEMMNLHLAEISTQVAPARVPSWSATVPAGINAGKS
jgi:hypothetical protein